MSPHMVILRLSCGGRNDKSPLSATPFPPHTQTGMHFDASPPPVGQNSQLAMCRKGLGGHCPRHPPAQTWRVPGVVPTTTTHPWWAWPATPSASLMPGQSPPPPWGVGEGFFSSGGSSWSPCFSSPPSVIRRINDPACQFQVRAATPAASLPHGGEVGLAGSSRRRAVEREIHGWRLNMQFSFTLPRAAPGLCLA